MIYHSTIEILEVLHFDIYIYIYNVMQVGVDFFPLNMYMTHHNHIGVC